MLPQRLDFQNLIKTVKFVVSPLFFLVERCVYTKDNVTFYLPKILTLTFLRGKCDEKLYRLNLALILIGQF
jgi:hypothetical protein